GDVGPGGGQALDHAGVGAAGAGGVPAADDLQGLRPDVAVVAPAEQHRARVVLVLHVGVGAAGDVGAGLVLEAHGDGDGVGDALVLDLQHLQVVVGIHGLAV